jgi:hypothetical protein
MSSHRCPTTRCGRAVRRQHAIPGLRRRADTEQNFAVVVAEQEGEAGQVGAQFGEVVAVDADEAGE